MSIEEIIIISWFLIGLITGTIIILLDMRGEEFDEDYFSSENIIFYLGSILLGYITTFIFIGICIYNHRPFTKFMYWLANIGVKKDGDNNET